MGVDTGQKFYRKLGTLPNIIKSCLVILLPSIHSRSELWWENVRYSLTYLII